MYLSVRGSLWEGLPYKKLTHIHQRGRAWHEHSAAEEKWRILSSYITGRCISNIRWIYPGLHFTQPLSKQMSNRCALQGAEETLKKIDSGTETAILGRPALAASSKATSHTGPPAVPPLCAPAPGGRSRKVGATAQPLISVSFFSPWLTKKRACGRIGTSEGLRTKGDSCDQCSARHLIYSIS